MALLSKSMFGGVTKYLFELAFAAVFSIYCLLYVSLRLSFWFALPLGFLNFIPIFVPPYRENLPAVFFVTLIAGFAVGWLIKKLWQGGSRGRIVLTILLIMNGLGFYILLVNSFKD